MTEGAAVVRNEPSRQRQPPGYVMHALSQFIEDHDASFDERAAVERRLDAVRVTVEERHAERVFDGRQSSSTRPVWKCRGALLL